MRVESGTTGGYYDFYGNQGFDTFPLGGVRGFNDSVEVASVYTNRDGADDAGKLGFMTQTTGGCLEEKMTIKSDEFVEKGLELNKSIEYAKDSIVSKTIIEKKTGTVSLFAFDEGQNLSEHTAPFDALVFVVDGEGEVVINKKSHIVSLGQMIIMPANIPHAVNARKKFKMLLIMIKD